MSSHLGVQQRMIAWVLGSSADISEMTQANGGDVCWDRAQIQEQWNSMDFLTHATIHIPFYVSAFQPSPFLQTFPQFLQYVGRCHAHFAHYTNDGRYLCGPADTVAFLGRWFFGPKVAGSPERRRVWADYLSDSLTSTAATNQGSPAESQICK